MEVGNVSQVLPSMFELEGLPLKLWLQENCQSTTSTTIQRIVFAKLSLGRNSI